MSKISFKNHIVSLINKYDLELQNLTGLQKANFLIKKDNLIFTQYSENIESLRKYLSKIDQRTITINSSNQPKELKTSYKVIEGNYHFYPIKGEFKLPIEIVDELFYSYSKHGLSLSSTEMLIKFDLQPWQWFAIKNALRLYQASHIFSPYTVEKLNPEQISVLIKQKMDQHINKISTKVKNEYEKSIFNKYKEVISKDALRDLEIKTIITELQEYIQDYEIKPIQCFIKEGTNDEELSVVITDLHIGVYNSKKHLPEFDSKVIEKILTEVAEEVNKLNAKKIHIFLLGDICESFSGTNHLDSWKNIEQGMYGSKLVINMYKMIVDFISKVNNVDSWNQVPGNHDRASASNKEDTEGFIAKIVFEFLKLSFNNSNIDFNYDDILISKKISNINFLATHGHLGISKKHGAELILEYGDPSCFNVLLQGHIHERKIKNDHKQFRDIVCPPLMKGNLYSITSGYSTNSGFLVIKENSKKLPVIFDYSI